MLYICAKPSFDRHAATSFVFKDHSAMDGVANMKIVEIISTFYILQVLNTKFRTPEFFYSNKIKVQQ